MYKSELTQNEAKKIRKFARKNFSQNPSKYDCFKDFDNHISEFGWDFETRTEFGRDKDRILYSKAFRKLQHKAQVHAYEKSDFYRTRLTHTLEVTQISRALSNNLGLNNDLTEAIALGHDIGHTPFGHAGEEVLDSIMRGEDDLGKQIIKIDYGGFKHNFNSVKILDIVEKQYLNSRGLNLTWQVLEGILKHTNTIKIDKKWNWKRFINNKNFLSDFLYDSYFEKESCNELYENFSFTLEGQIVSISDEIAQREHDLDDCFRNQHFQLSFLNEIENIIEITLKMSEEYSKEEISSLKKLQSKFDNYTNWSKDNLRFCGEHITKNIISYFITDVTRNSLMNINNVKRNDKLNEVIVNKEVNNHNRKYITKKLINFSSSAKILNEKLENLINNRIINSEEVNRFDGKSKYILRQLFKAYYENPLQMPKRQLKLLQKFVFINSGKYYSLKLNDGEFIKDIKFIPEKVDTPLSSNIFNLIKILKLENLSLLKVPKNFDMNNINEKGFFTEDYLKNGILKINAKEENINSDEYFVKCLLENHYAYMEVICDFISKMTDNYAKEEYKKLYLV